MKKLVMVATMAICGAVFAASEYQVYDFTMNVETTKAKGMTETACGDEYIYRDAGKQKIKGIIAGCGCASILANGSCQNALVILWNETTHSQITNAEFATWIVQRIAKKNNKVEHIAKIVTDEFEVMLGGIGTYSINKNDANLDHVNTINGKFGGFANAPYHVIYGSCSACAATPDIINQSEATTICDCACEISDDAATTPYFGTYTIKYNKNKSAKTSKNGISNASFGAPAYVNVMLGFED